MEEGLALQKPVLLFREKSEPLNSYLTGGVKQIGLKRAGIVVETSRLIEDPNASKNLFAEFNLSGDGHAAERVVQAIKHHFGRADRPKDYKPKTHEKISNQKQTHSVPAKDLRSAQVG
jgi:UDP-N-acetylglucosamine 2-epimerase (non-hydrolysing)